MPKTSSSPRAVSILLLIQSAGLVGLLSLHRFPHIVRVVGRDIHSTVTTLTEAASLIISIALTLIARGVAYRRKRAWILAVTLQGLLIAIGLIHSVHRYINHRYTSHLVFGAFGISHLIFEFLILGLLIKSRKVFNTVTDPHTRLSDLFYFLRVTTLSLVTGVVIVFLDARYFVVRPSVAQTLEITVKGFFGISGTLAFSAPKYQERLETILLALGLFIAVTSIAKLLRPIEIQIRQSKEARIALAELLHKYPSHDSLGYFALRDLSLIHI